MSSALPQSAESVVVCHKPKWWRRRVSWSGQQEIGEARVVSTEAEALKAAQAEKLCVLRRRSSVELIFAKDDGQVTRVKARLVKKGHCETTDVRATQACSAKEETCSAKEEEEVIVKETKKKTELRRRSWSGPWRRKVYPGDISGKEEKSELQLALQSLLLSFSSSNGANILDKKRIARIISTSESSRTEFLRLVTDHLNKKAGEDLVEYIYDLMQNDVIIPTEAMIQALLNWVARTTATQNIVVPGVEIVTCDSINSKEGHDELRALESETPLASSRIMLRLPNLQLGQLTAASKKKSLSPRSRASCSADNSIPSTLKYKFISGALSPPSSRKNSSRDLGRRSTSTTSFTGRNPSQRRIANDDISPCASLPNMLNNKEFISKHKQQRDLSMPGPPVRCTSLPLSARRPSARKLDSFSHFSEQRPTFAGSPSDDWSSTTMCNADAISFFAQFIQGTHSSYALAAFPTATASTPMLDSWIHSKIDLDLREHGGTLPSDEDCSEKFFLSASHEPPPPCVNLVCKILLLGVKKNAPVSSSIFNFAVALRALYRQESKETSQPIHINFFEELATNTDKQSFFEAIATEVAYRFESLENREQNCSDTLGEASRCAAERAVHTWTLIRAYEMLVLVEKEEIATSTIIKVARRGFLGISGAVQAGRRLGDLTSVTAVYAPASAALLRLFDPIMRSLQSCSDPNDLASVLGQLFEMPMSNEGIDSPLEAIVRHAEWCLESSDDVSDFGEALQQHGLYVLQSWLSLVRRALPSASLLIVKCANILIRSTLTGFRGVSAPTMFIASSLDGDISPHDSDLVTIALQLITLALSTAVSGLEKVASTLVPLHVEALRDAVIQLEDGKEEWTDRDNHRVVLHLRSLIAIAAHADPVEVVDAFRYCGAVPLLLDVLSPPKRDTQEGIDNENVAIVTERSSSSTSSKENREPSFCFGVGDEILCYAKANNGKERWFPAVISGIADDASSFDVEYTKNKSTEAGVQIDRLRPRRGEARHQASMTTKRGENARRQNCSGKSRAPCPDPPEEWCFEIPKIELACSGVEKNTSLCIGKKLEIGALSGVGKQASFSDDSPSLSNITATCTHNHSQNVSDSGSNELQVQSSDSTENKSSEKKISIFITDPELHELCLTLLLCLCVGRATNGGELEPAFCSTFPLASTGPGTASVQTAATSVSETPRGLTMQDRTLTGRSLSARSVLLTARSSECESVLEIGSNGAALGFHVLDSLHRHANYGDEARCKGVAEVVPRVIARLEAWKASKRDSSRGSGALRLLRLVCSRFGTDLTTVEKCVRTASTAKIVGRGRFGTVLAINDECVAKVVERERSGKDRSVARDIYSEIAALERLSKYNGAAVNLIDYGVFQETYVLIFERCNGGSLAEWRSSRGVATDADLPLYLSIFQKVVRCIACVAAANVVHLDLKCDNILLRADPAVHSNREDILCIGDFGEARVLSFDLGRHAALLRAHGTECVQPPEVLLGVKQQHANSTGVGPAADIWAAGCLLYELVSGIKLFEKLVANDWCQFFVTLVSETCALPKRESIDALGNLQKSKAKVAFLLNTCLHRSANARPTATQLESTIKDIIAKAQSS